MVVWKEKGEKEENKDRKEEIKGGRQEPHSTPLTQSRPPASKKGPDYPLLAAAGPKMHKKVKQENM